MKQVILFFVFIWVIVFIFHPSRALSVENDLFVPFSLESTAKPISSPVLLNDFLNSVSISMTPTPAPDFCMEVPVLFYHHTQPMQTAALLGHPQLTVDSNVFDEHIKYLKDNNYNIISAEDLVYALLNRQQLPLKTVVVTIDDGYDDNYTYAFAIAKKYQVVMNFMIPTDLIGRPGYMTWDHLREMTQSPYAKIYNHTADHLALGYLSFDQIEWQLNTSSGALKSNLGLSNTIFTYPYGSYSDLAIETVRKHGFSGAFTTIDGKMQCKSQIMLLQRTRIGNAPLSNYRL